jgi:hypothetical protein
MNAIVSVYRKPMGVVLMSLWMCIFIFEGVHSFTSSINYLSVPRILSCRVVTRRRVLSAAAADEEGNGVQAVSLEGLGDDHESVGENMSKSVAAWLDAEVRVLYMSNIE